MSGNNVKNTQIWVVETNCEKNPVWYDAFTQKVGEGFSRHRNRAQRPSIGLNKRFLPRPNTTTAWKLLPHRSSARIEILHVGDFFTKSNEFECNCCKAVFVLVKISFWKIYIPYSREF